MNNEEFFTYIRKPELELNKQQIEFYKTLYSNLQNQTEWQPIETAPRDGSMFISKYIFDLDKHEYEVMTCYHNELNSFYIFPNVYPEGRDLIKPYCWKPFPRLDVFTRTT